MRCVHLLVGLCILSSLHLSNTLRASDTPAVRHEVLVRSEDFSPLSEQAAVREKRQAGSSCSMSQEDCESRFGRPARGNVSCKVLECDDDSVQKVQGTYTCFGNLQPHGPAQRTCEVRFRLLGILLWRCTPNTTVCAVPASSCPAHAPHPYHERCYNLFQNATSSRQANQACTVRGGHLARVVNEKLDFFLVRILAASGETSAWIYSYLHYELGEVTTTNHTNPRHPERECALIFKQRTSWAAGVHSGMDCERRKPYFCEYRPQGVPAVLSCGLLPSPANGQRIGSNTTVGSVVKFECDANYLRVGPATRTCTPIGIWDQTQPTCKRDPTSCKMSQDNCEQLLGVPYRGRVNCTVKACNSDGDPQSVDGKYHCDSNYTLSSNATRSCTIRSFYGIVTYADCKLRLPVCSIKASTCPRPNSFTYSSTCYKLYVQHKSFEDSKSWCAKDGGKLADVFNEGLDWFLVQQARAQGVTALWIASYNHNTRGPIHEGCPVIEQRRSSRSGNYTWSKDLLKTDRCTELKAYVCQYEPGSSQGTVSQCSHLPIPPNGHISSNGRSTGNVAHFRCDLPYRINGSASRTCLPNGLWTGSQPRCDLVNCGNPPHIPHGSATYTLTFINHTATYGCGSGYTLQGSAVIVCTESGSWSTVTASCRADNTQGSGSGQTGRSTSSDKGGISTTTLAAAIVSAAVAVGIILIVLFVCARRRRLSREASEPSATYQSGPPHPATMGGAVGFENNLYTATHGPMPQAAAVGGVNLTVAPEGSGDKDKQQLAEELAVAAAVAASGEGYEQLAEPPPVYSEGPALPEYEVVNPASQFPERGFNQA